MANDNNAMNTSIRHLMAMVGGFSILSLFGDVVTLQENIGNMVNAFTSLSRPAADFLFGWIAAFFDYELKEWMKDYLIVGLVMSGGLVRALSAESDTSWLTWHAMLLGMFVAFIWWPIIPSLWVLFVVQKDGYARKAAQSTMSAFIYFVIFLAGNYLWLNWPS